ncbi:hypothetical protein J8273_3176 [Carpediemonas membranifera]|uniref:Uncharacterized protein n=1 Tax=Carpediemonas membranifera TaxID=201153 RepID=A0A8J6B0P3_9EUKA|nr:hypothetical protein J8273_3176 [Carpediemonas membranifera]|eukprot:KAG9393048.1 hypothetical protein J8273_3176 [Carpediemonas membranifera]
MRDLRVGLPSHVNNETQRPLPNLDQTIARLASKRYTTASPALQGSVLDLRHLRRTGMIQSNGVVFFLAANCA